MSQTGVAASPLTLEGKGVEKETDQHSLPVAGEEVISRSGNTHL